MYFSENDKYIQHFVTFAHQTSCKSQTRHFVDCRRVKLVAGSGGKGMCTFHSEPRKEWGGPDGGNGGDGGSIIIKGELVTVKFSHLMLHVGYYSFPNSTLTQSDVLEQVGRLYCSKLTPHRWNTNGFIPIFDKFIYYANLKRGVNYFL